MIAQVAGELARVRGDHVVVDIHGVGYQVFAPVSVIAELPPIGSRVRLFTHTHVKEDAITLYGFLEEDQQTAFELLLGVSGVGPKVALNILSILPVEQLISCVSEGDHASLSRVPGIGPKTAQRIVLELKEKAAAVAWERKLETLSRSSDREALADVIEGLVALGYPRPAAKSAAEAAVEAAEDRSDASQIVKTALKTLNQ